MAAFLTIVVLFFAAYNIMRMIGKNHLMNGVVNAAPAIETVVPKEETTEEENTVWQEGWIKHNGRIYSYNEDIITFLIMGIDKEGDVVEVSEGTNGGQADAQFLLVLNPHDRSINVVGINRNTMTDVDIYNEDGAFVRTQKAQIAVQHGFGNGVSESCEYQVKAVRGLFYDLPIHGYAAINMSAIPTINDLVGGVSIVVAEDLTKADKRLKEGSEVELDGSSAYLYVRWRDFDSFGSADRRLDRQKQYLKAFINKAKSEGKKNISIVSDIYKAVSNEMTTDITLDEALYLAPEVVNYSFGEENFRMIEGQTIMGERFEEFYPDEQKLYEMILDLFYEEVELP
ncbi:MAG: LCP family protein [Lachnospiraceae bacterium]|nr:LCP family protein [Lachnospiraceae bacterium]